MSTQPPSITSNLVAVQPNQILFLMTLTLISMAGLVGSDIYLPVMPAMANIFGKSLSSIQFTLSIYLFGLSIGQLVFGPLSEKFGRKQLIIIGMFVYFVASFCAAISSSYIVLIIARFFQAVGACTGLVIGRAIVGDLFSKAETGKIFSTIFPFVGMSPAISPVIGGFLGYYFGWSSPFYFSAIFAGIALILVTLFISETLPKSARKHLNISEILLAYAKLLTNRQFLAYASAPCIAYFAYFAYITQSPFLFSAQGYSERIIGTFYITLSLTYVAGNLLGRRLLKDIKLDNILKLGFLVFNLGGLALFLAGLFHLPLTFAIAAISILTFGNGFLIPLGTAGVITSCADYSGYASGLLGFIQIGLATLASATVGIICHNSLVGLGFIVFISTLCGALIYFFNINK